MPKITLADPLVTLSRDPFDTALASAGGHSKQTFGRATLPVQNAPTPPVATDY